MVLREASWLAAVGITGGVCVARVMGRLIAGLLCGPPRRAAAMNPMRALRHELARTPPIFQFPVAQIAGLRLVVLPVSSPH
jgi:hypothetical protein